MALAYTLAQSTMHTTSDTHTHAHTPKQINKNIWKNERISSTPPMHAQSHTHTLTHLACTFDRLQCKIFSFFLSVYCSGPLHSIEILVLRRCGLMFRPEKRFDYYLYFHIGSVMVNNKICTKIILMLCPFASRSVLLRLSLLFFDFPVCMRAITFALISLVIAAAHMHYPQRAKKKNKRII